jgi:hypothetical protein
MGSQVVQPGKARPQPIPPTRPETPAPTAPAKAHQADPNTVPSRVHREGKVG